jgi:hypothetical protein
VIEPQQQDSVGAVRRVEGRLMRGKREAPEPIANHWVVLHRVGSDRAGPLDSMLTRSNGGYAFRYKASGDTSAVYFVSTTYGGVAYFTSPFRGPVVTGDDAVLTVFDTTSRPIGIKVGGRHLIVGSPQPGGRRPIGEVYDLQNDSTVTLVARDSTTPVWTTHLPESAVQFQVNSSGEVAAGAMSRKGSVVSLFVPISPGIRQVAFTYELPASAFPLSIPVERPTGVFEILIQEPTARVQAPSLREMAPVSTEGRTFRRFVAQDLAENAVVRVDVPRIVGADRERVYFGVAITMLAAMLMALIFAARRGARRPAVAFATARPEPRSQSLMRAIAALDAEFEQHRPADDAGIAAYHDRRTRLKSELAAALAAERPPA